MFRDDPNAVLLVLRQINGLRQNLMGLGIPKVTPQAQVDDKSLAGELRHLQTIINEFLEGKY